MLYILVIQVYMDGGGMVQEMDVGMGGKDEVVEVGNCKDEGVHKSVREYVGTEDSGEGEVVGSCKDEVMGAVDGGSVCVLRLGRFLA